MPTLHAMLKTLPWKGIPAVRTTVRDRGRTITRTIKVVA
ncbi:MAG: ISAs1 family transposase, partial [Rhodococcus sp.]|nr:ISAs1 family transposase [Rhodococcus sp. (in: high G+C Gram-positive bacteria)]